MEKVTKEVMEVMVMVDMVMEEEMVMVIVDVMVDVILVIVDVTVDVMVYVSGSYARYGSGSYER